MLICYIKATPARALENISRNTLQLFLICPFLFVFTMSLGLQGIKLTALFNWAICTV